MFTLSEKVLNENNDKMEAAIRALSEKGLWDLVEYRWIQYLLNDLLNEKAKVPVLKVMKNRK